MKKITILLLEDDADLLRNLSELLKLAGYDVLAAGNGKVGLDLLKQNHPDLVLCDIVMPELDGYSVLRAIQNIPDMADVPFIFLSEKLESTQFRQDMNLGADDYLIKPFSNLELLELLSVRLKKIAQIKEKFERDRQAIHIDNVSNFNTVFSSMPTAMKKHAKPKQLIYLEGDPVNYVYCIVKGKAKTYKTNENGKEIITGLYKEGDIFGYTSIFEPYENESCMINEEADLLFIPREKFLQIMEGSKEVAAMFINILSSQLLETNDHMLKLAYDSSRKKIADALLHYLKKYRNNGQENFHIDRSELSAAAGVTKESVSRTLSDFTRNGVIGIDHKNNTIKINNYKELEALLL